VEEARGWRVGIIREFVIGVVKLKRDYMIMTSELKGRREMSTKTVPEIVKLRALLGTASQMKREH
jgi:hypothetical protein